MCSIAGCGTASEPQPCGSCVPYQSGRCEQNTLDRPAAVFHWLRCQSQAVAVGEQGEQFDRALTRDLALRAQSEVATGVEPRHQLAVLCSTGGALASTNAQVCVYCCRPPIPYRRRQCLLCCRRCCCCDCWCYCSQSPCPLGHDGCGAGLPAAAAAFAAVAGSRHSAP